MTPAFKVCFVMLVSMTCVMDATTVMPDLDDHEHHEHHEHKHPTLPGKCPDFPSFTALDTTKFAGNWSVVQIGKDGFEMKEEFGRCVNMSIVATPDGGMSSTMKILKGDKIKSHSATSTPIKGQPGKFMISDPERHHKNTTTMLIILDTDYTNYGTGIVCVSDGENHGLFVDVISRTKTLDPKFLAKAKASFDAVKLTIDIKDVDQSC